MVVQYSTQYVDEKVVAKITGRKVQTLRNDRHLGRGIPYSRIGRSIKYDLNEVFKYMQQRRVETLPY